MSVSAKSLDLLSWRGSGGSRVIQPARPALANSDAANSGTARIAAPGALAIVLVAALVLAGCGRKAGLDAPPMAAAGDLQGGGQPGAAPASEGKPAAPLPDKRKTILDWLID
jgi:predicted small lipoprotein YifL